MIFEEYLAGLTSQMREAKDKADRYDREWNQLNDQFNAKHRAEAIRRKELKRPAKTEALKRQEKSDNYELSDAFVRQSWWQGKAQATAAIITAECLLEQRRVTP
jgi:hypothetical protein